ncbi:MAG: MarR family transcriptional regulator [Deltaproteobacteria bacterium]|nr:MarR family transcriptional regulator [Deltaproteobacteria bacterium]
MSKRAASAQADELRGLMQQLFRRFGALTADSTPCGMALSMAHAHALMVTRARGELSQRELGAELRIDKSNVARLCARMVDAGHAEQRPCVDDGRSRRVSLTERGQRLAREVEAASAARFGALLGALPAGRRDAVLDALQHLVTALDLMPAVSSQERSSA